MSSDGPTRPTTAPAQPAPGLAEGPEGSNWALIQRMLLLAWRFRGHCLRVLTFQSLLLILALGNLGLTGLALQYLQHTVDPKAKAPRWPLGLGWVAQELAPLVVVAMIAAAILAFALTRALLSYRATVAQSRLVQDIVVHLRSVVYDKLQRLSFRFFDANETGSIINRVTGDVQRVRGFVDGVIVQVVILTLTLAVQLIYMLRISARLTFFCLLSTPLLVVLTVVFTRLVKPAYRRNRRLYDKLILTLSENIQGIHVVKGFAREKEEIAKFGEQNRIVRDQQWWIFRQIALFVPLIGFITQINLIVLLGYGGYLAITVPTQIPGPHGPLVPNPAAIGVFDGLLVFAVLLRQFSDQVGGIANIANHVQVSLTSAERVFEVIDAPVEIHSPPNAIPLARARGAVRFENVTFGYHPDNPVLHDVSFEIKPGTCVAIVGATGSGKSTLLSLIPRFYDPQKGRVLVDGVDVRKYDLDDLRRNIGLVFQESFLFSNSVAANIAFGHPEATQAQIEKAARIAAAHDFIMALPHGYDTHVGERGSDLSGGQRQRLAIARAILLEPTVLVLDDPTAAIDPQTEHEILQAMDSAMKDRTTFVVAHRLSTLRRADVVVVLDDGRIAQRGTHEQLMAEQGHYLEAARLQIPDIESRNLLGVGRDAT